MRRREFTQYLLKTAALEAASAWAQEPAVVRLRDVAAAKNLLVGTAVSYAELQRPDFTNLLAAEASIVVSENDMKWQATQPEPERFDFSRGDALLRFASAHGQRLRGHNLCWHSHNPAWLAQTANAHNAADLLRHHITEVVGHYAGKIQVWDVVNEAIAVEDGRPDGLRNSPWLQWIGPEYLDIAFRTAAQADPHAVLTYNDYDLEQDSPQHEAKRRAVLQLLTSLRDRKAPIQALGVQSHLHAHETPSEWTGFHRFLDQVERLDLQVFVTELDVEDSELTGDTAEIDRKVGELYADYLKNVLQHRSVKAVLTWGLTDRDSWLNFSRHRKAGVIERPLPFNADLKPTPAFYAMRDAIHAATPRSA